MKVAYNLTKQLYNKQSISTDTKRRHYLTAIRPKFAVYAAQVTVIVKKMMEK